MASINELMLIVFLINLPFGYFRSKTTRFSRQWMMAVHVPVPFVFLLRIFSGFGLSAIPLLVVSDVIGQISGGMLRKIDIRNVIFPDSVK